VVFGNETYGLTTAEVSKCQLLATIPASPEYSSLNLAAAVQVVAYELRLACWGATVRPSKSKPKTQATHEEMEHFYEHLERTLLEVGFLNAGYSKKLMPRLRRLFGRAQLERDEVNILRGVIKTLTQPKKKNR
jgi:tRNA/rRNA methyltransferase